MAPPSWRKANISRKERSCSGQWGFRLGMKCHHHLRFKLPPLFFHSNPTFFQFSQFETEKVFDTVQILGGGRTEETATNIATLSGSLDLQSKSFTSASNFMIIKFKSDASVEKRGFRASWVTEPKSCGADLVASSTEQVMVSPNYPENYPGGLECLHTITAGKGKIITLEIEDFDMERVRDFLLIKDGDSADAPVLAKLTGNT